MGALWTIVGKDLRLRLRDRTVLLFGVVAPLVLAVALGALFGDIDERVSVQLAVAGPTDGALASALVDGVLPELERDGLVAGVERVVDRAAVVAAVEGGTADAGIVLLVEGAEVVGSADAGTARAVTSAIVASAADEVDVVATALAAAAATGIDDVPGVVAAARATPRPTLVAEAVGVAPLDSVTGVAAGISVFFLFFAVGIAVTGLLEEERDGTLARLRSAPVATWAPVAAKGVTAMIVGVLSMEVLVLATSLLLGARWGDFLPVLVVVVAGVAAATGLVGLVASLARTPESASSVQSVVSTVLGALGGSFFPIAAGGLLAVVSGLTPHSWFLRGIRQAAAGGGVSDVLPAVGVLLAMALVAGGLASFRFRRTLGA
jgi:ABC-2 type transport system permease protein